jgi:biopolymer transport protein ExbD
MAIKRSSKVESSFSMASMADIVFLLLLFLLIATTLINPNAIRLILPKSTNQLDVKPYTTVSITADMQYYVETEYVPFAELEGKLRSVIGGMEKPIFSLHADKNVPWDEIVKVMNIARNNGYTMIAATSPE